MPLVSCNIYFRGAVALSCQRQMSFLPGSSLAKVQANSGRLCLMAHTQPAGQSLSVRPVELFAICSGRMREPAFSAVLPSCRDLRTPA